MSFDLHWENFDVKSKQTMVHSPEGTAHFIFVYHHSEVDRAPKQAPSCTFGRSDHFFPGGTMDLFIKKAEAETTYPAYDRQAIAII